MISKILLLGVILHWSVMQQLEALSVGDQPLICDPSFDSSVVQVYDDCVVNKVRTTGCPTTAYFSQAFAGCKWCYDECGCFQAGGNFISDARPLSLPPQTPATINLQLQLFTRNNPNIPYNFSSDDISSIDNSNFNPNDDSKFLIGGFTNGDFKPHLTPFCNALLLKNSYNVFLVNWYPGSQTTYNVATANTRLLGCLLAKFMELLNVEKGHSFSKMHLIGHSLGSHAAGYAGERTPGLARITGLDPAGPFFDGAHPTARLDPTDATLVDVLHSDAGGLPNLGTTQNCGDVDFWPNSGNNQPACGILQVFSNPPPLNDLATCDHTSSVYYYIDSIPGDATCTYQARQCTDYNTFKAGTQCKDCGSDGSKCARMGFYADQYVNIPASLPFFLQTNAKSRYCKS